MVPEGCQTLTLLWIAKPGPPLLTGCATALLSDECAVVRHPTLP
jgi:hypothetical protein